MADSSRRPAWRSLPDAIADRERGLDTQSLLCVPVEDSQGRVFGVVELVNKVGGGSFTESDERNLREFTGSLGVLLEAWWRMSCACPPIRRVGVARESRSAASIAE